MTTHYLTQPIGDSICLRGSIHSAGDNGFDYRSYTQNGSSRKPKATVAACIPRKFAGYVVAATTGQAAVDLTDAYRDGEYWATEAAAAGQIRTVQNGKVDA